MSKRIIAYLGAAVLVCSLGVGQAFAASAGTAAQERPSFSGAQPFGGMGGERKALTEEEKAKMEAARAEREEKQSAFLKGLTSEQRALYDAAVPARAAAPDDQKQKLEKPDDSVMKAMQAKLDAFVSSLTAAQKTTYDELFGRAGRPSDEMTDAQKSDMEAMLGQNNEKVNAFIATLSETQKAAYEAFRPSKPATGQQPSADMSSMKTREEAFVATLSESQKAAYEALRPQMGSRQTRGQAAAQ